MNPRKYRINHYPEEKYPWYVQEIIYLDYGRFTTKETAEEHLEFLHGQASEE